MSGPFTITSASVGASDAKALIAQLDAELRDRYPGVSLDHLVLTPARVTEGGGTFLIAREGGKLLGCVALLRLDGASGQITRMYVRPSARRAKVGRRLLAELERHARQIGLRRLVLHTGTRQPEAIRLYESTGFIRIPGFGPYTPAHPGVCMAKAIAC
jgi:GNAT superfamily N-acetyltransferase